MSRKTQIGWIAVGVLLCLVSLALTLKLRDGDKAVAREDDKKPVIVAPAGDGDEKTLPPPNSATPFLTPSGNKLPTDSHFPQPRPSDPSMDLKAGRVIGPASGDKIPPPPAFDKMPPPLAVGDKPLPGMGDKLAPPPFGGEKLPPPAIGADKPLPPPAIGGDKLPSSAFSDSKLPPPPAFGIDDKKIPPTGLEKPLPHLEEKLPQTTDKPSQLQPGSEKPPLPPPGNLDKGPLPLTVPLPPPDKAPVPPPMTGQPLPSISSPENPKTPGPVPPSPPNWTSTPGMVVPVAAVKQEPGEPPLVAPSGPVQIYQVRGKTETLPDIARRTLGTSDRCNDILRLNPALKADSVLTVGMTLRLPPDACLPDEADAVKPLPALRPKDPEKAKVLPLTGTFPCTLDEHKVLTLPKAIRDQLDNCDTVLVSPGPDHCLWITNHAHLERLADRIEHSPARETDVRIFKRLYYAQTEKTSVTNDGRVTISDKLAQFAGLSQDMVLVGIDEHFELWDAAKWKQYTQQKSAAARAAAEE
jgi:MraZ protein